MKLRKLTPAGVVLAGVAIVLSLALVPAAFAGKNNPTGGSSTLTGPVMVTDLNGNGLANHGDSITFNVSTTASSRPEVGVRCYQGSAWVYDGYVGYFPDYMFTPYFTLDTGYWVSGQSASCTARLFYYNKRGLEVDLATLDFSVAP
jgi:hypothetical protein